MRRILPSVLAVFFGCASAFAETISVTGNLAANDPNDVFLYGFVLSAPGALTIQSWGYGGGTNAAGAAILAGGFDAYLSLFQGTGPAALFIASDDDAGCPPGQLDGLYCGDPRVDFAGRAPGAYTIALTAFGNMSFAENYGSGSLGDGFVGLGSYEDWRTGVSREASFAFDISGNVTAVPEPRYVGLLGLVAIIGLRLRRSSGE